APQPIHPDLGPPAGPVAIATVASASGVGMETSESATTKSASAIIDIEDHDFDTLVGSGEWLIEFYAPWCGYCSRFHPQYEALLQGTAHDHARQEALDQISPWHWTWSPFSFVGSVFWGLGWIAKALQTSVDFLKQYMPMWAVVGLGLVVVVVLSVVFSFILPDPPALKAAKAAAAAGAGKQGAAAAKGSASATASGAAPARGSPATQARRRRD
ncbi:hypothetical protein BCR44DRAFT_1433453, partial [Catenaria anguillulae PL171]